MIRFSSLKVAQCQTAADLIECNVFLGADALLTQDLRAVVGHFLGFGFIFIHS